MPIRLDCRADDFAARFGIFLAAKREAAADVEQVVRGIIAEVMARGDAALVAFTRKFDRSDVDAAGLARTDLADATLMALLPRVMADHASRHGTVPGGGMAVVLLGKAGGREMMAGSDLDLMLIYDHSATVTDSAEGISRQSTRSLSAPNRTTSMPR